MTQDKWLGLSINIVIAIILILIYMLMMLMNPAIGRELVIASVYGDYRDYTTNKYLRAVRSRIATGGVFDANSMAVAHRTLPFGTRLTLKHGHRSAVVVVNDRGPYIRGREFDLTPAVNKQLLCYGLCRVRTEPWPPLPKPRPQSIITASWEEIYQ